MRNPQWAWIVVIAFTAVHQSLHAGELVEGTVESDLVPSPVEYLALLPDGYADATAPLPLLLDLHGGGGDKRHLDRLKPHYDLAWTQRIAPPMVVVTPSVTARCFYMDFPDGSEKWESFIVGPFLDHLRSKFKVRRDRAGTLATGISMGGMGSLRLAFKHPDIFGAVASMEPGIEPILNWEEMQPRHRWWRADNLFHAAYGNPVDPAYWAANNPASIAAADPKRLRGSGLQIYIEAGDMDLFWLYEGTEFLHRVLYDNKVPHEYRLVRGADHIGATIAERKLNSLGFLARVLAPPKDDPVAQAGRERLAPLKLRAGAVDHYALDPDAVQPVGKP